MTGAGCAVAIAAVVCLLDRNDSIIFSWLRPEKAYGYKLPLPSNHFVHLRLRLFTHSYPLSSFSFAPMSSVAHIYSVSVPWLQWTGTTTTKPSLVQCCIIYVQICVVLRQRERDIGTGDGRAHIKLRCGARGKCHRLIRTLNIQPHTRTASNTQTKRINNESKTPWETLLINPKLYYWLPYTTRTTTTVDTPLDLIRLNAHIDDLF